VSLPLVIVPARQMSAGRPCKNREAWPALEDCLADLPSAWPIVFVSDDLWVLARVESPCYLPMGPEHTVSQAVRHVLEDRARELAIPETVIVLQPSSPTVNRASYVQQAATCLDLYPAWSSVVSVVPWSGEPPAKACTLDQDGRLVIPAAPEQRQSQPTAYRRDGTVYAVRGSYAAAGDLYGPRPMPLLIAPSESRTID
jgi:hypothetical protein